MFLGGLGFGVAHAFRRRRMRIIFGFLLALGLSPLTAQTPADVKAIGPIQVEAPLVPQDYVCPMDPDIRSDQPGVCSRCGMKLVLGVPDQVEYPLELKTKPAVLRPGEKTHLTFRIENPKDGSTVTKFEVVHERLFHMFIASRDLTYFIHDHPEPKPDGTFEFDQVFPKAGMYRVLGDFYPSGGTPQLVSKTVFVTADPDAPISLEDATLNPDLDCQHGENTEVELVTDPPQPIAGMKTLMFFRMKPADGLTKWLGAWAHMLAASDDLMDMIHEHPFIADGGPQMQFNLIFPRARTYRVFVQFERNGTVNTVAFNVPVSELK